MSSTSKWQIARLDDVERRGRDIPVLAGNTGEQLRRSFELLPRFGENARRDDDFAAVRDDPPFEEALS